MEEEKLIEINDLQQRHLSETGQESPRLSQSGKKGTLNCIQHLVSGPKYRYTEQGFDLDLTYLTNKIIVMSFPSEGIEKIYRNSMDDVRRFFDLNHQGHYQIYNFCHEHVYPASKFNGDVVNFGFLDHSVPTLKQIFDFCHDLDEWFQQDPLNVVGLHCKAGQGRSGVMVCCYLLWARALQNSEDALEFFGRKRFIKGKGVVLPSQIRYVQYFEQAINLNWTLAKLPAAKQWKLTSIHLRNIPNFGFGGGCSPSFQLFNQNIEGGLFLSSTQIPIKQIPKTQGTCKYEIDVNIQGDTRIEFFHTGFLGCSEQIFFFSFYPDLTEQKQSIFRFSKSKLEKAYKDLKNSHFEDNFAVEIKASVI